MFKPYVRTNVAEMRPVTDEEIADGAGKMVMNTTISVSDADIRNGSPRAGDMIARNPKNSSDQWLVASEYFEDNFRELL